jgi:hypothetical protein
VNYWTNGYFARGTVLLVVDLLVRFYLIETFNWRERIEKTNIWDFFFFFFFLRLVGFELRVSVLARQERYCLTHIASPFLALVIFLGCV